MIVPGGGLSNDLIASFQNDGAVLIPGAFSEWVDTIARGVEQNMASPSDALNNYGTTTDTGLFFDDYCNWQRISEFEDVVRRSPAATMAAALMQSETAQFFHEHVLVKEPGVIMATPWHSDSPYYLVEGDQTVSFWVPLDPVADTTLRLVKGSHRWPRQTVPTSWDDGSPFYKGAAPAAVVDPDTDPTLEVLEWAMQPGDAVAFSFRTTHGSRANRTATRRRAFSMRMTVGTRSTWRS